VVQKLALGVVFVVAAVLRFGWLTEQSFWYDEALTVGYVGVPFGDMLTVVRDHDANPPLYYLLAWPWAQLFGDSEAGLRSLSAVFGVLTVGAVYAAARELFDRRAGLAAAALVALNPAMIWYSQEARAYALVVLLAAIGFLFFARALRRGSGADLAAWGVSAVLAMATHYYAIFPVVAEALWLFVRAPSGRRAVAVAVGGVGAGGVALLPLALEQRERGGVNWIRDLPLDDRLRDVFTMFVNGHGGAGKGVALAGLAAAFAGALVLWRGDARARAGFLTAAGLGLAVPALALAAALAGSDYVLDRNLLIALVPLAIAVSGGVSVRAGMLPALVAIAVLGALFLRYDYKLATTDRLQRDDWRSVARELGPPQRGRLVVVAPGWQSVPLRVYLPGLRWAGHSHSVAEVDIVVFSRPGWNRDAPPQPPPGPPFELVGRRLLERTTISRFRAPRAVPVRPRALATPGGDGSWVFVEGGA
jgi:mannosyltransferase